MVDDGDIEGVDVSGRSFVMIADTPPNMADGNWRVGVIIDDGANEEQVGKFGQVLSGELGGPPAALGPFLGEFLGIEQGSISIEHDGNYLRVDAGALVDYTGERVTIESGDQVTLTNIVVNNDRSGAALVFTVASLAPGATANFTGSDTVPLNSG